MNLAETILLLQLINMGIDTGVKLGAAFDKIKSMSPEEVDTAIKVEHDRTKLLLEITHNI